MTRLTDSHCKHPIGPIALFRPPFRPCRAPRGRLRHLACVGLLLAGLLAGGTVTATTTAAPAPAGVRESGLPPMQDFGPTDYQGAGQNWALAQDRRGVLYAGNVEDGILSFDGARWQRIAVPQMSTVRSLALGPDGRIYAGTVGDLGYLDHDAGGQPHFVSLLDKLPEDARDFGDVWLAHASADGVVFNTGSALFRYRHGAMQVFKAQGSFHMSYLVDGVVHVFERGRGILRLQGDHLELLPGSERFADTRVYALLPWRGADAQPGELLLGTLTQGWFIYRNGQFQPWVTEADHAIREHYLYAASWLADGRLALATLRGGLYLLDAQGRLLHHLDRGNGLRSNMVLALLQDRQQGLWLATGNGIMRLGMGSPLTTFDRRNGLHGEVLAMRRHGGDLYAGTTEGLFRLQEGADARFVRVDQAPGEIWDLEVVDDALLAAGDNGIYLLHGRQVQRLADMRRDAKQGSALVLQRDERDPSRVFVGYQDGVGSLRRVGGRWVDEGRLPGLDDTVQNMALDAQGRLWMGLWAGGAIRLDPPPGWQGPRDPRTAAAIRHFDTAQGLPKGQVRVVRIDSLLRFITPLGLYRHDEASNRFSPDPALAGLIPGDPARLTLLQQETPGGAVWMYGAVPGSDTRRLERVQRVGKGWQRQASPMQPLSGVGINAVLEDAHGVAWIGADDGLFRYDTRLTAQPASFPTLLRSVVAADGQRLPLAAAAQAWPHTRDSLRFEFAAPSYAYVSRNTYQVWLEGHDHGWSPWRSEASRDYTALPPGDYRLHVRARNVHDVQGTPASYAFRILPPWYLTWWACLLWFGLGLLALALLLRWRNALLRRRNHTLTTLVARRTTELADANEALAQANAALAQQAITDPLTGLRNRRYLHDHLPRELAAVRRARSLSPELPGAAPQAQLLLLTVDIDLFKQINDSCGHAAGDRVLQQFAAVLQAQSREIDMLVRSGGEEFLLVAQLAAPAAAAAYAERLRAAVAAHPFVLDDGRTLRCTCSLGFACYPFSADAPESLGWEQLAALADECLYAAKRHGRNAWAGLSTLAHAPSGDVLAALQTTLQNLPAPGPLPLQASWLSGRTAS